MNDSLAFHVPQQQDIIQDYRQERNYNDNSLKHFLRIAMESKDGEGRYVKCLPPDNKDSFNSPLNDGLSLSFQNPSSPLHCSRKGSLNSLTFRFQYAGSTSARASLRAYLRPSTLLVTLRVRIMRKFHL